MYLALYRRAYCRNLCRAWSVLCNDYEYVAQSVVEDCGGTFQEHTPFSNFIYKTTTANPTASFQTAEIFCSISFFFESCATSVGAAPPPTSTEPFSTPAMLCRPPTPNHCTPPAYSGPTAPLILFILRRAPTTASQPPNAPLWTRPGPQVLPGQ